QDSPRPIAYLVSQRAFQTGTFLIQGVRSKDDRPTAGLPIYGAIGPGDWMLEDISGAIRISGIPAPEPGRRVILAAQFTAGDPQPSLKVLHMVASGLGDGTDVIRVGEHLHLPMPSSKSTSLYPEFSGDTAAIEALFLHESVILRGIRPGIVSVKVFEQWWNRAAPELHGEFKLTVKDREASRK
ncbi:MAG: hypothetical protein Q8O00_16145, partial [Holophaga sp.]|nr:hypothetical protein [Holophaga sp.]